MTELARFPDETDCCNIKENDAKNQGNLESLHPSVPAKHQDFDMSQLSRDFAQDFSQITDPSNMRTTGGPKCPHQNEFSPSACLSALKLANKKASRANPHYDSDDVSKRRAVYATNQNSLINESTVNDSGFQSADGTHVTASSFALPSMESKTGCESDIHKVTSVPSPNRGLGKECLDKNSVIESNTVSPVKHMEGTTQPTSSEKGTVNWIPPNVQVQGSLSEKTAHLSVLASGFTTASSKGIYVSSASLERAKHLFEENTVDKALADQNIRCIHGTEDEHGSVKSTTCNSVQHLPSSEKVNDFHLTVSEKADVTALCTLLEEANTQFEFTQFQNAKFKQPCPDNTICPEKADKELDPDLLGIDFDDSFNSDAKKHLPSTVTHGRGAVVSAKITSNSTDLFPNPVTIETSTTEDVFKHTSTGDSSVMSSETQGLERHDTTEIDKLDNNTSTLGVGFKTAGGNILRVSKRCLSKARALFADLEQNLATSENSPNKQSSETKSKTEDKVSMDNHADCLMNFKEEENNLNRQVPRDKNGKPDTTNCQRGFKMASGKVISISEKNIQKASALFNYCDTPDAKCSTSQNHKEVDPLSRRVRHKTNLQRSNNEKGMKVKCSDEPIEVESNVKPASCYSDVVQHNMETDNFVLKDSLALKHAPYGNTPSAPKDVCSPFTWTPSSKFIGSSSDTDLNTDGGFCTASGHKISVSVDAMTKAHSLLNDVNALEDTNKSLPNQIPVSLSEKCGFQTARGKGISISSAAVRKAKSWLSESDEVKICEGQIHSKMPVPGPPPRNNGFLAASGKLLSFSAEALQKTKSLFSDINFSDDVSDSHANNDEKQDNAESMDSIHCGFSTAMGGKLCVSQKSLLKSKNLLRNFDSDSVNEKQELDCLLKDCHNMDGVDGLLVNQKKVIPPLRGYDSKMNHPPEGDQRVTREKMHSGDVMDIHSGGFKNTLDSAKAPSLNGNSSLTEKPSRMCTVPNSIGCPAITELTNSGGFHTASGKKVSVSNEAMIKAKSMLNESAPLEGTIKQLEQNLDNLPTGDCGFQTASGNRVIVSSASLQKATILLSECEVVEDKLCVKSTHSKMPVQRQLHRNHRFLAASGKPAPFSSEALQKAKSLFSDIDFTAEIPALSDKNESEHEGAVKDKEMMHCGFTTAGGTKVHVSQKNLLKAKNLLKDIGDGLCFSGSYSAGRPYTENADPSNGRNAKRTSVSNFSTNTDKHIPVKGSAPQEVESLTPLPVNEHKDEGLQCSSECVWMEETYKEGKNGPSGASQPHGSPGDAMTSLPECEINQTSSSELYNVKKTDGSPILCLQSLHLSGCSETQQRFLAQEALDCTKALLEDESLAGERQSMTSEDVPLHDNPQSSIRSGDDPLRKGKRLAEDQDMTSKCVLFKMYAAQMAQRVLGFIELLVQNV